MASSSSMNFVIIKEKIQKVLAIHNYTSQMEQQVVKPQLSSSATPLPRSVPRNSTSGNRCPFGSNKIMIVKASEEFTNKALRCIFWKLYSCSGAADNKLLDYYLSVFELAAPGIMSSNGALQYFNDFGYDVNFFTITSYEKLQRLQNICLVSSNWEFTPKDVIIGICLYVLLIVEQDSFDYQSYVAYHVKEISTELGIKHQPKGFWTKNFASKQTCVAIKKLVNIQPLKATCFRGIQQMAESNSIGRHVFGNIVLKLSWNKMEHLKVIFDYLLEDPYFQLVLNPLLDRHLKDLLKAMTFLDGLPPRDVPYAYFLRDELECQVLHKDNLTVFVVAVKPIFSLTKSPSHYKRNFWNYGYYHMYPAMTPYLEYIEETIRRIITPVNMDAQWTGKTS